MTYPLYWLQAIEYLSARDKIMAELIATYPGEILQNYHNPFYTLTRAIVGQQISVRSAEAIWRRLESLLKVFSPEDYLKISEDNLRECGLSRQKITYIRNISFAFKQGLLTPLRWYEMSDEEIVKQLVAIRGIGPWTAQMFLIFHLNRPDILPLADIGFINALQKHYGKKQQLSKVEILELSQLWKPYQTVATWYLWRSLDPVVVQY